MKFLTDKERCKKQQGKLEPKTILRKRPEPKAKSEITYFKKSCTKKYWMIDWVRDGVEREFLVEWKLYSKEEK